MTMPQRVTGARAPAPRHVEPLTLSATREHAETLLRGIDALTRKVALLDPLPLDVIDRYERILVAAHVANLLRLSTVSERVLSEMEPES